MKVLIGLIGLLRSCELTSKIINSLIIQPNPDISFDFIFNTSSINNQISKKEFLNNYNYNNNEDIINIINNTYNFRNSKNLNIIFQDFDNISYPGLFFDRIINILNNIDINNYSYFLFLRFDTSFKMNYIDFNKLNNRTLYFFNGNNSQWYHHDKDIDFALLGSSNVINTFFASCLNKIHFYHQLKNDIYNYKTLYQILSIYDIIPFNSRWKIKYADLEKEKTINDIISVYNHTKKSG